MSDLGGEIEQRRNHASCGKQLRNRAERLEIHARALANQRQNDDVDLSVVKILLLMPDHLQMMVAFQATQTSQNSFAISKAVLRRSQESIGSEIFSIIDCGTMKVRQKNLNTSAGTLCGQV